MFSLFLLISIPPLILLVWYVFLYEPSHFILREKSWTSRKLKKELRILHLSDFHLKRDVPRTFYPFIERLAALDVDLVVLTGDLTHEDGGYFHLEKVLKKLKGKMIYAVMGNHDAYSYSPIHRILPVHIEPEKRHNRSYFQILKRCGVRLLRNEEVQIKRSDMRIWGAEYTDDVDPLPPLPDYRKSSRTFNCLMVHTPDLIPSIKNWDNIDLILAGHTHGGQIRFPFFGHLISRTSKLRGLRHLVDGLNTYKGSKIHVSRGMGQGVVLRFRCYPEAVLCRILPST